MSDTIKQEDLIRKADDIDTKETSITNKKSYDELTGHSVKDNGQHQQQQLPSGTQHGTEQDQTFGGPEHVPMDLKGNRKE